MAPKMTLSAVATLTCSIVALTTALAANAGDIPRPPADAPQITAAYGSTLARVLPKLQPFDADEITVHAERPATLSPASRTLMIRLSDEHPSPSFAIHSEPVMRLALPLDREVAPEIGEHAFAGEVSLAAGTHGSGIGVGIAQRASLTAGESGEAVSRGAEVRIGRRLKGLVAPFEQPTWDRPAWYLFAASDGQALTWTPASGKGARDIRLQDRVTIGDVQAGVSIQARGLQASLTYMEREVSNAQRSDKQSFTGIALTMRR